MASSARYEHSAAQLSLAAQLGGLRAHLSSDALKAVGELLVSTHYRVSRAAAAVQPPPRTATAASAAEASLRPAVGFQVGAPDAYASQSSSATLPALPDSALPAAPSLVAASTSLGTADEAAGSTTAAAAAPLAKSLLSIEAHFGHLVVVLHEEAPPHVSGLGLLGAASAAAAGLADLRLDSLRATFALGLDTMQIDARVVGLGLTARDGLGKPPLELLSTAGTHGVLRGQSGASEARAGPDVGPPPPLAKEVSVSLLEASGEGSEVGEEESSKFSIGGGQAGLETSQFAAFRAGTALHIEDAYFREASLRAVEPSQRAAFTSGAPLDLRQDHFGSLQRQASATPPSVQRQGSACSVGSADVPTVTFSLAAEVSDAEGGAEGGAGSEPSEPRLEERGGLDAATSPPVAEAPLLTFAMRAWDESCLAHPGYDSEVALELMPIRVCAPLPVIRRLQLCLDDVLSSVKDALDRFGEQLKAAAAAAAAEAARKVATQKETSGAQLRITLHGPLVILPSATVGGAALVVRMADAIITNASDGAADHERARAPSEARRPEAAFERLCVTLENTSVFVASSTADLDRHLELQSRGGGRVNGVATGAQPHWVLNDLKVTLTIEKQMLLAAVVGLDGDGEAEGEGEGTEEGGTLPGSFEVHEASLELTVGLELSAVMKPRLRHESLLNSNAHPALTRAKPVSFASHPNPTLPTQALNPPHPLHPGETLLRHFGVHIRLLACTRGHLRLRRSCRGGRRRCRHRRVRARRR